MHLIKSVLSPHLYILYFICYMKNMKSIYVDKNPYIYELNTYNRRHAKENIDVIAESLNNTKISLSKYIQDVDILYDNADSNGFEYSLKLFDLLQNNLVNELKINCSKVLSNNVNAIPFKVNRNKNEMVSVEKLTRPRKNFELGNLTTELTAHNNNRDNLHFSNIKDNRIVLTIGNNNIDPQIYIGTVIQIYGTTNYNGHFQCKDIIHKWKSNFEEGVYEFYAAGLRHVADEDHSQTAVCLRCNGAEAQMVGYNRTQMKPHTMIGDGTASFDAAGNNVSTLTISCINDGEIQLETEGGTFLDATNFATTSVIKIEGSQVPEYNGLFKVKTAGNNTLVTLWGGNSKIYKANHLATETSAAAQPFVRVTNWVESNITNVSAVTAVGVSQNLTKSWHIGDAGTIIKGGFNGVVDISLAENNGILTVTTNGTPLFTANVGEVFRIAESTNYNGYYMVVESVSSSNTIKLYMGDSTLNYADEKSSTKVTMTQFLNADLFASISVSESDNKQFKLGNTSYAGVADDNADGFLLFQNRDDELIKMTIGKYLDSPNICVGTIIHIQNTIQYDGIWAVKYIDSIHSSDTHGVYILIAPGLENKCLEKYYSNANISIYASNVEQQSPFYHCIANTKGFAIKLNNCNKHIAFYVPGITIYIDEGGLMEVLLTEKKNNLDIVYVPPDNKSVFRLSGKSALASNLEELKEIYLEIIGSNKDLDNINPNQHILCLITSIEIIINSLNSIQNAPYLY